MDYNKIYNALIDRAKSRISANEYVTNGTLNKMISPSSKIPMGWRKGMTKQKVIRA